MLILQFIALEDPSGQERVNKESHIVKVAGAQSAYRVLDVLTQLGYQPSGMTLGEVAARVNLPPSTARRLLLVLCDTGFAVHDPAARSYRLGARAGQLRTASLDRGYLRELARPALERLRDETTETVFFSVLDGDQVTYLDCLPGAHRIQMFGQPGMKAPVHATAQGRALAAQLDESGLNRLLAGLTLERFTENTLGTIEELRDDLRRVRVRGYALNLEELEPGVVSVASAVVDSVGHPVAAVCIGGPSFRIGRDELVERFAAPVLATAAGIAELLFGPAALARGAEPGAG